jgi:hypothetical protein
MIDIYAISNIRYYIPSKIKRFYRKVRKIKRIDKQIDAFSSKYRKCKNTLIKKYLKYE